MLKRPSRPVSLAFQAGLTSALYCENASSVAFTSAAVVPCSVTEYVPVASAIHAAVSVAPSLYSLIQASCFSVMAMACRRNERVSELDVDTGGG